MGRRPVAWDLVASSGSLSTRRDVDGIFERIEILERLGVLETMVAELAVPVSGLSLALRPPARCQVGSRRAKVENEVEVEAGDGLVQTERWRRLKQEMPRGQGEGERVSCWSCGRERTGRALTFVREIL